jgi:AcrR family transcriptional regulator
LVEFTVCSPCAESKKVMNRADPRTDARANRERVIAAAHDLFSERGAGAEIRDIADRAGVAVGTIYRNYPTKGDLVAAVLAGVIAEATARADAAEALPDRLDGIRVLLEVTIEIADRYGWLSEAVMRGQFQELAREHSAARSYKTELIARFERLIRAAIESGQVVRRIDAEVAAALLASVGLPYVLRSLPESRSGNEIAAAVMECVLGV